MSYVSVAAPAAAGSSCLSAGCGEDRRVRAIQLSSAPLIFLRTSVKILSIFSLFFLFFQLLLRVFSPDRVSAGRD